MRSRGEEPGEEVDEVEEGEGDRGQQLLLGWLVGCWLLGSSGASGDGGRGRFEVARFDGQG